MLDTTNGSVRIITTLRPGDTVEWCNMKYVVTEIYGNDGIWGHRADDLNKFEYLLGYADEMTLIRL
jgi:hypothetical protein